MDSFFSGVQIHFTIDRNIKNKLKRQFFVMSPIASHIMRIMFGVGRELRAFHWISFGLLGIGIAQFKPVDAAELSM